MFWSIESFHINTTWKVGFLACVLPGSVPIRRSLLSKWTHLHTRQCSMCSMAKQLCGHAKSRKSMLFMQTLLTKQCLTADVTQKPARFITFSIVKSLSSPVPERGSVVLIVFLRFGLSSKSVHSWNMSCVNSFSRKDASENVAHITEYTSEKHKVA